MRFIDEVLPRIKDGIIPETDLHDLKIHYGERFSRGYETVLEKRVMKYVFNPSNRIVWIVLGKTRDYLQIGTRFCNCDDFFRNVINEKSEICYHLLARLLAESLNAYKTYDVSDERYDTFMKEWRKP